MIGLTVRLDNLKWQTTAYAILQLSSWNGNDIKCPSIKYILWLLYKILSYQIPLWLVNGLAGTAYSKPDKPNSERWKLTVQLTHSVNSVCVLLRTLKCIKCLKYYYSCTVGTLNLVNLLSFHFPFIILLKLVLYLKNV